MSTALFSTLPDSLPAPGLSTDVSPLSCANTGPLSTINTQTYHLSVYTQYRTPIPDWDVPVGCPLSDSREPENSDAGSSSGYNCACVQPTDHACAAFQRTCHDRSGVTVCGYFPCTCDTVFDLLYGVDCDALAGPFQLSSPLTRIPVDPDGYACNIRSGLYRNIHTARSRSRLSFPGSDRSPTAEVFFMSV
jgi:hypothetical protein